MFKHLKDDKGQWAVRDDVWVWYKPENGPVKAGPLGLGFTPYGGKHHFGPELQFGHVVGDCLPNQVLLIKTAWGGKSLYRDFRPPSSGGDVGPYYKKMLAESARPSAISRRTSPATTAAATSWRASSGITAGTTAASRRLPSRSTSRTWST